MSSFLSHRRKAFRGGAGIKAGLVAWYDLEEASGTRSDAHTNGLDLTENGTSIDSTTGKVGDAAEKIVINTDSLYHADDALLDITGDMTIAGWMNFTSVSDNFAMFSKWTGSGNQRSYMVYKGSSSTVVNFIISTDGTNATYFTLSSGSLSVDTWYFVTAKFVAGGTSTLYINNSSVDSGTAPSSIHSGSSRVEMFSFNTGGVTTRQGLIDSVGVWDRALDASEITTLYNSGNGVAYSDL